jgi:glycosyltransferase involved in cell wall biosynthesis
MKKVLIVTYYFPPSGGPGVQRVLKFVKYLPQFGWQPVILTVHDAEFPARDESLFEQIPRQTKIYRTDIAEPHDYYRRVTKRSKNIPIDVNATPQEGAKRSFRDRCAEFIRGTFFIPDARIGWYPFAVSAGKNILSSEPIDVLYSSSPPYTCALIAAALHRFSHKPWVAGFRDPWTGFLTTPRRWAVPHAIDRLLERRCYTSATAIEAAWEGIIEDILEKVPELDKAKFHHIPNGFDSDDYPRIERHPNKKFTITYVGSLDGKRNPEAFLRAVRELACAREIDLNKIQLQFAGRFAQEVHEMLRDKTLSSAIQTFPYLPHREALALLLQSDVLLLNVHDFRGNERIIPGKLFEYLAAQRPIIAIAPEGAVTDIIRQANAGKCARAEDLHGLKAIILEYYRDFWGSGFAFKPKLEAINHFHRKSLTAKLSALLDYVSS